MLMGLRSLGESMQIWKGTDWYRFDLLLCQILGFRVRSAVRGLIAKVHAHPPEDFCSHGNCMHAHSVLIAPELTRDANHPKLYTRIEGNRTAVHIKSLWDTVFFPIYRHLTPKQLRMFHWIWTSFAFKTQCYNYRLEWNTKDRCETPSGLVLGF